MKEMHSVFVCDSAEMNVIKLMSAIDLFRRDVVNVILTPFIITDIDD